MPSKSAALFVASICSAIVAACGGAGDSGAPECSPSTQRACTCLNGAPGTQTCWSDGKGYTDCGSCGSPTDDGGPTADSATDSAANPDSSLGGRGAFSSSAPLDSWEAETHLAIGTNGYVVAAWTAQADATLYIGYSFSTDYGATWGPVKPIPIGKIAVAPSVAVDLSNNFYVTFGGYSPSQSEMHVYAAKAYAGTTTFGPVSEVTDPVESTPPGDGGPALYTYDKPWIVVTGSQEIVVTYTRIESGGTTFNVMAARSPNAISWTRAQVTTNTPGGAGADTLAFPCASVSTGRLWVVHEEIDAARNVGVVVHWSDDDGATWSAANRTVVAAPTPSGVFDDPSCAGDASDLWVEYELANAGGKVASAIQVAHSSNGGATFGAAVDVLDTAASPAAWHAQIALEAKGHLDVEYFGGADYGDTTGSVFYVNSMDNGATWSKATTLKTPITLTSNRHIEGWLGDYLGMTTAGPYLYSTYTDNSSGTAHIGFAKALLP